MGKRVVIAFVAMFVCVLSGAQRTTEGSSAMSVSVDYSFTSFGLSLDYNCYLLGGLVKAGVSAVDHRGVVSTGERFSWPHIAATGDYLYRIIGTRDRALNVNAGGGMYFGCEFIDIFNEVSSSTVMSASGNRFIMGLDVQVEVEYFFGPNTGLVFMGRCPFDFFSAIRKINPEISLGVKYNF